MCKQISITKTTEIDRTVIAAFEELLTDIMRFSSSGIRPGLERVARLLECLGSPERSFKAIHVLGTNGKGSTAATLESVCRAAGLRTALYTSPHLVSLCERLRIDGRYLPHDIWRSAYSRITEAVRTDPILSVNRPTFFENLTAMAFLMIAEAKPDVAIIEAGMGGRYDATSACDAKAVIITSISMDHREYLGETLEAIASEKFAAVRSGVPAFFAGDNNLLADQFKEQCGSVNAPAYVLDEIAAPADVECTLDGLIFTYTPCRGSNMRKLEGLRSPLLGFHQAYNQSRVISFLLKMSELATVQELTTIGEHEIRVGLSSANWPGRMEVVKGRGFEQTLILDGAHNEQGVQALTAALSALMERDDVGAVGAVVFAVMKDKDIDQMLGAFRRLSSPLYLTELPEERSMKAHELFSRAQSLGLPTAGSFTEPMEALKTACAAAKADELVVCCGSLHLVGYLKGVLDYNV